MYQKNKTTAEAHALAVVAFYIVIQLKINLCLEIADVFVIFVNENNKCYG